MAIEAGTFSPLLTPGGWFDPLTDADAWFITTDCPDGLKYIERKAISGGMEGDFETGNMRYKARERYSFGWSDPLGMWGSSGST